MKHLKFSCIHLLTAATLVFTSCSDNDDPKPIVLKDTAIPAITLTEGSVKKDDKIELEGKIKLNLTLTDNVELASWGIEVDPIPADGESAEAIATKKAKWDNALKDVKDVEVTGKSKEITTEITVPANADLGNYTVKILAKDKAGNVGEASVEIEIVAKGSTPADTTIPTITFDSDSAKAGDKIEVEGNIEIKATIADETELDSWSIDIDESDATKKAKWDSVLASLKDVAVTGKSENIDKTIKVPADADPGEYTIKVSVKDKAGNIGEASVKIEVTAKSGS